MSHDLYCRDRKQEQRAHRPAASLTERARAEACRRVGQDGHDVAAVAVELGVGWHTIMRAVEDHGRPRVDDPALLDGVVALGMDETASLAANARHHPIFVTGIVDLTGRPRLPDVVLQRTGTALYAGVSAQPADWRSRVGVAALDPFRGYASALTTSLPHPVRVLDAVHVTRLGLAALDDVHRRVQRETLGHRGHRDDPLYRIRRPLRRASETLTDKGCARLLHGLDPGDPHGEVAQATAAQELRFIYARGRDWRDARRRLHEVLHAARSPTSPTSNGSAAPSTPGARICSPTSPTAASPTDPPKVNLLIKR